MFHLAKMRDPDQGQQGQLHLSANGPCPPQ